MKYTNCVFRYLWWNKIARIRKWTTPTVLRTISGSGIRTRSLRAGSAPATFPTASIGRVIAVKRRCGLGSKIVEAAIDVAKTKFRAEKLTIEAQVYARSLYEKHGFYQTSEEFLEDGIPHIQMQLNL